MATAAQVIKAALQRIIVQDSEAPLQADEFQDSIFALNNYMFDLDAEGITLGFTEITSLGDAVTVPVGALRGVIANLAIEMAADFDATISPALQRAAEEGIKTMRKLGVIMGATNFPSTLPIGSGNYDDTFMDDHFYPGLEAEILAETTGAIGLEVATNATAEGLIP